MDEAIRGTNTLNLIFTNNATLVNNVQTMPQLTNEADNKTVYINMNIKPQVCKQPPQRVYKYNKVDWNIINDEVKKLSNEILKDERHMKTQQMWTKTEEGLQQIIDTKVLVHLPGG